jgi:glycosyltransferase involved in cell wall biosynthesis
LRRALAGLFDQTDPDWRVVIVDDASPRDEDRSFLVTLEREHPGKISVLLQDENRGAGVCRNIGVTWAWEHGSDLVLFHDADDVSHPHRLERSKAILAASPDVDLVYSTYVVVDEHERPVPHERIAPLIAEVLEAHRRAPPQGADAWIRIGTETGFVTPMTTVAVRTELAMAHPFPSYRVSEDSHTWLRMSAGGGGFAYEPSIPQLYRIPQDVTGSSNYHRFGKTSYLAHKVAVDTDGFCRAVALAFRRHTISREEIPVLERRFFLRLAQTMENEGEHGLARELLAKASAQGSSRAPSSPT